MTEKEKECQKKLNSKIKEGINQRKELEFKVGSLEKHLIQNKAELDHKKDLILKMKTRNINIRENKTKEL